MLVTQVMHKNSALNTKSLKLGALVFVAVEGVVVV